MEKNFKEVIFKEEIFNVENFSKEVLNEENFDGGNTYFMADCHCDSVTAMSPLDLALGNSKFALDFPRLSQSSNLQILAFYIKEFYKREFCENGACNFSDNNFLGAKEAFLMAYRDLKFALSLANNQFAAKADFKPLKILTSPVDFQNDQQTLLLLSLEGAELLHHDLPMAERLYEQGFRAIGFFWNYDNWLGCGANANLGVDNGLTAAGFDFVTYCETRGFIIDLAHSSRKSFKDVFKIAKKPVLVSHGNCGGLWEHHRNLDDEQLQKIGDTGSLFGISYVPSFMGAVADINSVVEHICYAVNKAGVEAVALGSDFEGTDILPTGLGCIADVSKLPDLLLAKGLKSAAVENILGKNLRRFVREVL